MTRPGLPLRLLARAAAALALLPGSLAAQDRDCPATRPPAEPVCSVAGMIQAVNPPRAGDAFGNLNPEAFAGGANADLMPGQASLSFSGAVAAGGAACARHLSAVRRGGTEGVPGLSPGMAEFLEGAMDSAVDVPVAAGGTRRAVFEVFSPNAIAFQGGSLHEPLTLRHDGVGGWPRNAGAHLVIALTDAGPGDLEAGGSYQARAVGADGDGDPMRLYTAWTGNTRWVPYGPPNSPQQARRQAEEKAICRSLRQTHLTMLDRIGIPLDATEGRLMRDWRCDMRRVAQAGTRTEIDGGTLTGTVTIERITETAVIGRFELSGPVDREWTSRVWRYGNETGLLAGVRIVERQTDPRTLRVNGRFAAPNMRRMGYAMSTREIAQAAASGSGNASGPTLELIEHTPARQASNVSWETPGLRLTFNRPLDPASLVPGAVRVETAYGDGAGGETMRRTDVALRLADAETIVVVPDAILRDGVRYRVTVPGGAAGPRGAEGATLPTDRVFTFETMVDLDDIQTVEGLPPFLRAREGIESNTFQVAIDAPLVRDKPAVIRTYVKWAPDPDIADGWEVTDFRAHVRARNADDPDGPPLAPELVNMRIKRPDTYTPREIRMAENTVNLFGWTPQYEEASAVRVEVEPARQCGTPRVFSAPEPLEWHPLERELRVGYVFAKVGPWRNAVPTTMMQEGRRVAREAERFARQQFPVQDVTVSYAGEVTVGPDLHDELAGRFPGLEADGLPDVLTGDDSRLCPDETWTEKQLRLFNIVVGDTRQAVRDHLLKAVHDGMAAGGMSADYDATVVFMPYEWIGLGGAANYDLGRDWDGSAPDFAFPTIAMSLVGPDSGKTPVHEMGTVTHELGHVFGLDHIPAASDAAATPGERCRVVKDTLNTRMDGIEGMRLDPDGRGALNKSSEEGNAEHKHALLPLMHPSGLPKAQQFITREHYLELLDAMGPMGAVPAR
ncbi:Ig-like domain-containing protein [Roseospira navarrensis]|uniref:SbsA Ig-like domain-containing protein n=1 Tax=Roseospira navarrensis TaxID=140058 RepID=A0A7X1ZFK6_9PROT|nr:Ig-like domain-containing protein [Roseospira navarrensis]MQX36330.1 hypothetical protein [Roseospira navarrensis]